MVEKEYLQITSIPKDITISLSESDSIAINDAINHYKDFIKEKIGDKIKAPYWARLQSIKNIERKLKGNI